MKHEKRREAEEIQFAQSFLMVSSALFIGGMSVYALTHRKNIGAVEVAFLGIFAIIWTLGSYFELQGTELLQKLFWRDVQQVGVFGLPVATMLFAVAYTGSLHVRRYTRIAVVISAITVVLIWTNPLHHLMRSEVYLLNSGVFGQNLTVNSTTLGSVLVAYNFSLPLFSIIMLFNYARKLAPGFRKQVYWITASFTLTFLAAFIRTAFLEQYGIYIHISVLYIPSAVILFLSLFRYSFFRLSPIARDKVFEVIGQGIFVMDKNGIILEANSAAVKAVRELFGVEKVLAGSLLSEVFDGEQNVHKLQGMDREQSEEIVLERETGTVYLSLDYYPLGNRRDGSVLILNNITRKKVYELKLREQAELDALTGLMNRSGFESTYESLRVSLKEKGQPFSLFMMDLDNFKSINDTFGHAAGDKVLEHFAASLRSSLREEDVIGRIGGEEFSVLLPNTLKEDAVKIAERIRKRVCEAMFYHDGREIRYTVSIGVTDNRSDRSGPKDRSLSDIMAEADSALYAAKRKSRNCTVVYTDSVPC